MLSRLKPCVHGINELEKSACRERGRENLKHNGQWIRMTWIKGGRNFHRYKFPVEWGLPVAYSRCNSRRAVSAGYVVLSG